MECGARWRHFLRRAVRRKSVESTDTHTALHRCLNTLQMTAIGLGSTIGVGIYVLLGVAIRDYAGPGVVLSFLLAGLVVLTNAVIYAEFGSHIPHTGAAYTYVYCTVGELAAFLTGWMGLLSITCSAATGARAWSGFVDSMFNNSIQHYLDSRLGHVDLGPPFSRSLDWTALAFFLLVTLVVSCNVRCSAAVNGLLAVLTTAVLVFVTIAGPVMGDLRRLADPDTGGFLPYGLGGVVTGASAAFFAFNGYDAICISAEEARDPVKSVPRAILLELLIVTVVYCGSAVGTACLVPYNLIDLRAPIPSAFAYQGATWARLVVTVGPILAISNLSILGLYAMSRIAYRMSCDGLLLSCFHYVHPRTKVPLGGVIFFGVLVSVVSLLLELKDLVRFSVLCMLFQYILLALAFIALRAQPPKAARRDAKEGSERASEDDGAVVNKLSMEIFVDCEEPSLTSSSSPSSAAATTAAAAAGQSSSSSGSQPGRVERLTDPVPRPSLSAAPYSYVTDGDLGFGAHQRTDESSLFGEASVVPERNGVAAAKRVSDACATAPGSEGLASSVQGAVATAHEAPGQELKTSDFADESHTSEAEPMRGTPRARAGLYSWMKDKREERVDDLGCFENTARVFFRLLTTRRCLGLLVSLLAGLALQLGLGWEDFGRAKLLAVASTSLMLVLIVFLCEVLRKRCGPGHHQGFKVPFVPYLPALSCFLNMLLLVSAADITGIIEFSVLVFIGLLVYVILMMSRLPPRESNGRISEFVVSEENYALLGQEDNDADSEGSSS